MRAFKKIAALILSVAMITSFGMPAFAQNTAGITASGTSGVETCGCPSVDSGEVVHNGSCTLNKPTATPPNDTSPKEATHYFYKAGDPDEKVESAISISGSTAFKVIPSGGGGGVNVSDTNVSFGTDGVLEAIPDTEPDGTVKTDSFRLNPIGAAGSTTVTYTDTAKGILATMTVTVEENPQQPEAYNFYWDTGSNLEIINENDYTFNASQTAKLKLFISNGEGTHNASDGTLTVDGKTMGNLPVKCDAAEVSKRQQNQDGPVYILVDVLKDTQKPLKITFTNLDKKINLSLDLSITGTPVGTNFKLMMNTAAQADENAVLGGKRYNTERGSDNGIELFHFGEYNNTNYVKAIAPKDIDYSFTKTQNTSFPVQATQAQIDAAFTFENDPQGNPRIILSAAAQGSFILTPTVNYKGKSYTMTPFYWQVNPPKDVVKVIVEPGDSINADLDKWRGQNNNYNDKNYILYLKEGTYDNPADETIIFDLPVKIEGAGIGKTIVKSHFIVNADENERDQEMEKFTIEGTGSGIGITDNADNKGSCRGGEILVKGFDIGVDMRYGVIPLGPDVSDCNIGVKVYVRGGGISVAMYRNYTNNGTALQIQNTPGHNANPFAMGFYYCNFIDNGVNVENLAKDVKFNFSFNYYDDVSEGKFIDALASPYYKEKTDTINFTCPETLYIAPNELTNVSINADKLGANDKINTTNFIAGTDMKLVTLNDNGAATKFASWSFAAPNSAKAREFNPAIATELKDTSAGAAATLPSGASYQPVSFAHSGALPGTAAVSVVKDAQAPTANLKLYKVVGNTLVLQPDAVTFADGEYRFNRDSASDYLITDTVISAGENTTGGANNSNSSGGANDYISGNEIKNQLEGAAGGNVSISVSGKPLVSTSAFDTLKNNPDKTLTLKGDGYAWNFKGSDLINSMPGLIYFDTKISGSSPNAAEIKRVTGGAETINVYFSYHGQLPGKATIDLAVDNKYNGKTLNFYYYNAATKQLETVGTGLPVKNGKVSVSITHCSDYILSPTLLNANAAKVNPNTDVESNPETGAAGSISFVVSLAMISCAGILAIIRKRKA